MLCLSLCPSPRALRRVGIVASRPLGAPTFGETSQGSFVVADASEIAITNGPAEQDDSRMLIW